MTISLKHAYQSAVPDSGVTSLVQPSNWNEEHVLTLATNKLVGRTTAGTGAAEEISVGANLTLSAGTLAFNPANVSLTGDTVLGSAIGDSTTVPNQSELQYTTSGFSTELPDLNLDFTNNDFLDPRITFSRTSNATVIDRTGKLTYAPNNITTYSEQFDNAAWTKTRSSITANTAAAPDGTYTADKLVEDSTATNSHFTQQSYTGTAGVNYIFSVYLKASERTNAAISLSTTGGTATGFTAVFNLSTGVVSTTSNTSTPLNTYAAITSVGNGWYRCYIGMTLISTATALIAQVAASDSSTPSFTSGLPSYTGNGSSGIFVWGAQVEAVTYQNVPSTYVRTVASAYYGPRFDYDPVSLAPKGLLIEEARTNLALRSQEFDNASWTKTASTINANATTAPDGTVTADKFISTAATAQMYAEAAAITVTSGTSYTFSIFAKASEYNFIQLRFNNAAFSGGEYATFNLSTGTIAQSAGSNHTITSFGNGWYRCVVVGVASATTNAFLGINLATSGTGGRNPTITGDGTSGLFIWGAQLEAGAFATSYIPTGAASVARTADSATMTGTNFSSWFNQGPVNLLLQSQTFENASWSKTDSTITANTDVAPDGTTTADTVTEGTAGTATVAQAVTVQAGATVAVSIYAKRGNTDWIRLTCINGSVFFRVWVNLATGAVGSSGTGSGGVLVSATTTSAGSGWYRIVLVGSLPALTAYTVFTNTASADNSSTRVNNGTYILWGSQVEVGQTATPYAVTTTASASLQPAVGTMYTNFDFIGGSAANANGQYVASLFNDVNNSLYLYNGSGVVALYCAVGGAAQAFLARSAVPPNVFTKAAYAFQVNDIGLSQDGGAVSTDTSALMPAPTSFVIGGLGTGSTRLNGHIQYLRYYARRLSDTILRGSSTQ